MNISVAIDGPAGSGKSTIASIVANRFNLMYINTGSMYRTVTLMCRRNNIPPTRVGDICNLTNSLNMYFDGNNLIVNEEDVSEEIRLPDVSNAVSSYAAIPQVREILVKIQQAMANKYDIIMDGRDIGTVVLKNSPLKFYLTASAEERAKRRFNELNTKGIDVEYNNILNDIIKRDFVDSNRETNPLRKAEDAIEIDSSKLSINEVVEIISDHIKEYIK